MSAAFGQAQPASDCKAYLPRQTVVYIDDQDMVQNDTILPLTLAFKLTASLMPGERVSIVQLQTKSGTSNQVWTGCWPMSNKGTPIEVLQQQIDLSKAINDAAVAIYNKNTRTLKDAMVDGKNPPKRQIVRALLSDAKRGREATEPTIRGVIYSDMAENSDFGSVFTDASRFTNKDSVYLPHFVFHSFTVGKNVVNVDNFEGRAKSFWTNAFKGLGAVSTTFTSEFAVPLTVPQQSFYYSVTLTVNGTKLPGKIAIMADKDKHLVDSWIGISRLGAAGLVGKLTCDSDCSLNSQTDSGIINADRESIRLRLVTPLVGEIISKNESYDLIQVK
jgi:hypothetical protein